MNAEANRPLSGLPLVLASGVLAFANLMAVLDVTIANVSVPYIAGGLAVSANEGTWVITSYGVAEAIAVPLTGWLAVRFGPIKVFMSAMIGFGICSALCGVASSFGALVAFRVLQGFIGGPMIPLSQTLLLQIFPKEKTGQAMNLWAVGTVIGPVLGPILGGVLCDTWSWPWIFWVNVPATIIGAYIFWRTVGARPTQTVRKPIDVVGLTLLIIWVGSLQIILDKGHELDWFGSPFICGLSVLAAIGFGLFLIWELTDAHPIVDLSVFAARGYGIMLVVLCLCFGGYFASVVMSPLWMQSVMGYTATYAGAPTAATGFTVLLLTGFVRKQMARYDNRGVICFGILMLGAAMAWRSTFATNVTISRIALSHAFMGLGLAFFILPVFSMALSTLRPEQIAAGAGMLAFCRTTATAFAASLITTGWTDASTRNRSLILERLDDRLALDATSAALGSVQEQLYTLNGMVQEQSVMLATNEMYALIATILFLLAFSVWLAPKPKPGAAAGAGGH
jgi:DHA2 family multidrug resistance protein